MAVRAINPARDRVERPLGARLRALGLAACARLLRWHELSRQRRALLALDERMLKDIGVNRAEAEREARRPFWRDDRPAVRRADFSHTARGRGPARGKDRKSPKKKGSLRSPSGRK